MLADQRHQTILERVRLHGRVKATELAGELGVSEITVRRDLNDLHDAGLLTRVHGGAVRKGSGRLGESAPRAIGIIIPSRLHYFSDVLLGAESAARGLGVRLVLGVSGNQDLEPDQIARMESLGVDGLLMTTAASDYEPERVASWLADVRLPTVLVERSFGYPAVSREFDHVRTDHPYGAAIAFRHLHGLGHRKFAAGLLTTPTYQWLELGCRRAEAELGLEEPVDVVRIQQVPSEDYSEVLEDFLERGLARGVRGYFLHNDTLAAMFVDVATRRGIRVPQDIAVIAYDDVTAGFAAVPLTAVAPPKKHLGAAALAQLMRRLTGGRDEPVSHQAFLPSLTVRDSCGGETGVMIENDRAIT